MFSYFTNYIFYNYLTNYYFFILVLFLIVAFFYFEKMKLLKSLFLIIFLLITFNFFFLLDFKINNYLIYNWFLSQKFAIFLFNWFLEEFFKYVVTIIIFIFLIWKEVKKTIKTENFDYFFNKFIIYLIIVCIIFWFYEWIWAIKAVSNWNLQILKESARNFSYIYKYIAPFIQVIAHISISLFWILISYNLINFLIKTKKENLYAKFSLIIIVWFLFSWLFHFYFNYF